MGQVVINYYLCPITVVTFAHIFHTLNVTIIRIEVVRNYYIHPIIIATFAFKCHT